VPRTTAYGWLKWFGSLPEGLRDGILEFMAAQVPIMAWCPDAQRERSSKQRLSPSGDYDDDADKLVGRRRSH